ncbi:hypothetical protein D3C74_220580 [compost metagenome]
MLIAESMHLKKNIKLVLFGEFYSSELTGLVTKIDLQHKTIGFIQGNNLHG